MKYKHLKHLIPKNQIRPITSILQGEEGDWMESRLVEIDTIAATMPRTYGQDGNMDPIAYLHYFSAGADWYITELDVSCEDTEANQGQPAGHHQAFGLADLGYGPEKGYISIPELLENRVELDLHFKPQPISQLQRLAA